MRIALVTEFYYPHLGGVSKHVHQLALDLRRRGHDATVITSNMTGQGDDPPFVRRLGTSRLVYSNGSFARITTGFGLRRRMTRLLRETGADVVHLQDALAPTLGLVASSAGWRMGLPVVGTFHTWFRRSPGYWAFRRLLQPRLDRPAARLLSAQSAPARRPGALRGRRVRRAARILRDGGPVSVPDDEGLLWDHAARSHGEWDADDRIGHHRIPGARGRRGRSRARA